MTSRLFLTLLAFFTGFAVQNAPAEARILSASSAEIGVVAVHAAVRSASVSAVIPGLAVHPGKPVDGARTFVHGLGPAWHAPAVLVRVDRARE